MSDLAHEPFERYAIGQPVTRTEDPRLLRGAGCFTDDFNLTGQAHAYVLRSTHAHGIINSIDVAAARVASGVLDVLTWTDLVEAGIGWLPCNNPAKNRDGSPMIKPPRPSLASARVRHVGEAVALIVAESAAAARDASELIEVDITALPSVTHFMDAIEPDAPQLHDEADKNIALDWEFGDAEVVEQAFASAHHVTRLRLNSNRVVVNAMEPRAAVAQFEEGRYTLHVPTQGAFGFRNGLANNLMKVPVEQVRVRTYDVGGSFGMKSALYPEYAPLLLAAKRLGRAVKWCDERSASFVSDQHGRDSEVMAELAFDADQRIVAGRVHCYCNNGAYLSPGGPSMHTRNIPRNFPGGYRLPVMYARTRAIFTNTTPIGAYRGAGRPEGVYYMERLLDQAADEMGMARIDLRRRNLVTPIEMPFDAVSELTYDSGNFPAVLESGLKLGDVDGFDARRKTSALAGKLRGLGVANYLEVTGPPAREMGGIRFEADDCVTMISGSLNYGQGHAATFAQIVTSYLGVPFERLQLLQGDSDELIAGAGTGGSRTVLTAGTLLMKASDAVIAKGKLAAAHLLEASALDIEFAQGRFSVAGTDRQIELMDLVARLRAEPALPDDVPDDLSVALADESPPSAFPNGCHVAEVEVDPETGVVELVSYAVVDDFGTLINPMLVEGQVHGGIAQGLGQVLLERTVYDDEGQLLAGSYMDYAMPRASDIPPMRFASQPDPAKTNPLGAKGCGEAGTSGSMPAVMNAVLDVLKRERGITDFDMPATPERVWSALRA
jgi:aerobic carbon-monoxide dehydrogenase large subunit